MYFFLNRSPSPSTSSRPTPVPSQYNTAERTTHFTNQTFRPSPATSATAHHLALPRDPRDPRNPRDRRHLELETLTSSLDFDSESSSQMTSGTTSSGGTVVGSEKSWGRKGFGKKWQGRKGSGKKEAVVKENRSRISADKVESGFSPDITFWQTPVTDHSAALF